jgi:hypothetical protein
MLVINCSVRFKNNTIADNLRMLSGSSDKTLGFHAGLVYESPVMLKTVKSIILKYRGSSVEIPVN